MAAKSKANSRPLIVKKVVEGGGHGHHGGAWKVAYADFVTAMMAFFLLLWLLSTSSEETLKGLAEYFSESITQVGPPGGVGGALQGLTVVPDAVPRTPASLLDLQPTASVRKTDRPDAQEIELGPADAAETGEDGEAQAADRRRDAERLDAAKAAIEAALSSVPDLARLKESLVFDQTPEGLRIQIVDREHYAMFPLGSDVMYPHTRRLLEVVAQAVRGMPNRISIRGHTDARPFAPRAGYDNWRLSADRANATRLALVEAGLDQRRIAEVVGRADAEPLFPDDPYDPRNRRISLVLLHDRPPAPPGRKGRSRRAGTLPRRGAPPEGGRARLVGRQPQGVALPLCQAAHHQRRDERDSGLVLSRVVAHRGRSDRQPGGAPASTAAGGSQPGVVSAKQPATTTTPASRAPVPWPASAAETLTLPSPVGPLRAGLARPIGRAERGTVLLFQGRGEFLEKYAATVERLLAAGFVVFGHDWRGQGGSPRLVAGTARGHIEDFAHYLEDVELLVERATVLGLPQPWYLLGHSLGGHLALRWLATGSRPVRRAALVTPMLDIALVPPPRPLVRLLAETAVRLGAARRYALGQRDPRPNCPFTDNPATSCPEGFAAAWELLRRYPEHRVGGVTWGWLAAALRSIAATRAPGFAERITIPILLVRASQDRIVCNRAIGDWARRLPRAVLVEHEGARHDLFFERAEVQARLLDDLVGFFAGVAERSWPRADGERLRTGSAMVEPR